MKGFAVPTNGNQKLEKLVTRIRGNQALKALLDTSNVNSITRLGYNDHGPVHVKIVANLSLKMLRILTKRGIKPNLIMDYKKAGFSLEDSEVLVVLGSLLHDIGMALRREEHEKLGLVLAYPLVLDLLDGLYPERQRYIMASEVMHCILMHESDNNPLTMEAGIVKVADALDMENGRARIPFEKGKVDIHSVSAMAIDNVLIMEGKQDEKPIKIVIEMNNSAGIFQVDSLLKPRIYSSGLEKYISVDIHIATSEKNIIKDYKLV